MSDTKQNTPGLHRNKTTDRQGVVTVKLTVPEERSQCANWILSQPPDIVADVLGMSHTMHSAMLRNAGDEAMRIVSDEHEKTLSEMREQVFVAQEQLEKQLRDFECSMNSKHSEHEATHQRLLEQIREGKDALLRQKEDHQNELFVQREHTKSCSMEQLQLKEHSMKMDIKATQDAADVEISKLKAIIAERDLSDMGIAEQLRVQYEARAENERETYRIERMFWKSELQKRDENLERSYSERVALSTRYGEEIERIQRETHSEIVRLSTHTTDTLASFRGAQAVGALGERIVSDVFQELEQIGTLEDTRGRGAQGYEDYLWRHTIPGAEEIRCSVEVKCANELHSIKDIEKHEQRIRESVCKGSINAGLFVSLRCKVQNTKLIELKQECGIPVLYVSRARSAGDISVTSLVEHAFRIFIALWPHISSQKDEQKDQTYGRVLEDLNKYLHNQFEHITTLDRHINDLVKTTASTSRAIVKLQKARDAMFSDTEHMFIVHPTLSSNIKEMNGPGALLMPINREPITEEQKALSFERAKASAKQYYIDKQKRYPKTWEQMKVDPREMDLHGVELVSVVAILKEEHSRLGRKRSRGARTDSDIDCVVDEVAA